MKTEIKIRLKFKDIEVELSQAEIIELQGVLNSLFPKVETVPWVPTYPVQPMQPYYWEYIPPVYPDTTSLITWGGSGG